MQQQQQQACLRIAIQWAILLGLGLATTHGSAQSSSIARSRSNLAPRLRAAQPQTTQVNSQQNRTTTTTTTTTRPPMNARLTDFSELELPADFYEMPAEQLDLGMNATGRAPVPILSVAVLQSGQPITSAINVHPGTPLEMVMYLDDASAKVYGLQASSLSVRDDTYRNREEAIIQNGCSIDTYIFGNFEHNPEDGSLRAKFRAFKFPDSSFVRFVGKVNVCIKQCAEVACNGRRKKRAISGSDKSRGSSRDDRLVLTVSTVLRISDY